MKRKTLPKDIETKVLTKSRRRCCICFGLANDLNVKSGQIAHLDQKPENAIFDNLAWLCFMHHDQFDSITSQSKGLTIAEAKQYRAELYNFIDHWKKLSIPLPQDENISLVSEIDSSPNLEERFLFSDTAIADIDYRLSDNDEISLIIRKLKTHDWNIQNPAITKLKSIGISNLPKNQAFVLGRNIYQSACGGVFNAIDFMKNIRAELSIFSEYTACYILCGMFFEVYFNSKGEFREYRLKNNHITSLFGLQTAKPYKECIRFIQMKLKPFKKYLVTIPNDPPIQIPLHVKAVKIRNKESYRIKQILCEDNELLNNIGDSRKTSIETPHHMWKLTYYPFTIKELKSILSQSFSTPVQQISIDCNINYDSDDLFTLPPRHIVTCPYGFCLQQ